MANPRDGVFEQTSLVGGHEMYIHPETGRTHERKPAGGTGGGLTSYADAPVSEERHVAFLKSQAEKKKAESDDLMQKHEEAHKELKDKREAEKKGERKPEVNNPITDMTYGRPEQNAPGLDSQGGPRNPGDGRDGVDNQPMSSARNEDDRRTPVKETA
jgi:hypothetical protein